MKRVLDILNQGVDKKKDQNAMILTSDQRPQYTSYEYLRVCTAHGLLISHTRKANPLDNSNIENFHSLLKKEILYNHDFALLENVIHAISDWMTFYNISRISLKKSFFYSL